VPDWLIWIIVAAVLAGAEMASLDLVLIMLAGGAAAAAVVAPFGSPAVQVAVAVAASAALLVTVRPVAKRHLTAGPEHVTGSAALVGREAVVLERVDAHGGYVRLNGGRWSARAFDRRQVIEAGETVSVMEIDGATAVVYEAP
jgi:membrane protein implicated in regulation of membrane protease activity